MRVDFTRRRLLRLAAAAAALPGAANFLAPWLQGAEQPAYDPKFFDKDDFAALEAFAEILIPTDGTPGAREARCAQFIDFLLQASSKVDPNMARQWRTAMQSLRDAGFHAADAKGREELVAANLGARPRAALRAKGYRPQGPAPGDCGCAGHVRGGIRGRRRCRSCESDPHRRKGGPRTRRTAPHRTTG